MAIRAKADITISRIIDIKSVTRYYLLQSSSSASPTKPTTNPPASSWATTEPTYTSGATSTLYFVDCTVFTNGTFSYSDVSKSSSYEAAKEAYNKAKSVETRIVSAETKISQNTEAISLRATKTEVSNIQIGGRNYFSTRGQKVFDENGEFTLTDYQSKGSFTQFYNLTVPMNYFAGKNALISFEAISPNGTTNLQVHNTNGAPRYLMCFPNGNGVSIGNVWAKIIIPFTITDRGDSDVYDENASNKIEIYCPDQMGCKVRRVKVEVGTKFTDYTPAPEDMATADGLSSAEETTDQLSEQMTTRIQEMESTISQMADSIAMLVVDQNGSSLMEQTSTGWVFSMGQTLAQLQKATDDLKNLEDNLDRQDGNIIAIQNVLRSLEELNNYVRISVDGDEPTIELGNAGEFKLVITNTGIKMMDGTSVPAYVTNQSLKIGKAEVEDELVFGGFAFAERANGNMGLIWKGE